MIIKRKEFIQIGSLATASLMLPKFLKAFEGNSMVPPGNKVLVVLQLSGGKQKPTSRVENLSMDFQVW